MKNTSHQITNYIDQCVGCHFVLVKKQERGCVTHRDEKYEILKSQMRQKMALKARLALDFRRWQ